ncbi:hypothetical protein FB107DRAFT_220609 [Schizophyllum commune]
MYFSQVLLAFLLAGASLASAESHTVKFTNKCGTGTPKLYNQSGKLLHSGGGAYKHNGPLVGAIAYLQTGHCGANGDNCPLLETTLRNPTSPGAGSSTDISLIPPHAFTKGIRFEYYNGCDGKGKTCKSAGCKGAFHKTDDYGAQVQCEKNGVDLHVIFCPA